MKYAQYSVVSMRSCPCQENNIDNCMQGRMHRLLASFGNPHLSWPAVHVAGTKGKGSTTAMLASILRAAQYRVGTYTRSVEIGLMFCTCMQNACRLAESAQDCLAAHM